MSGVALIELERVSRAFKGGVAALADVSLVVERGEFVAITGPSGCGKTTLLSLLVSLDHPSSGRILFEGRDLRSMSAAGRASVRRRFGIVFQHSHMIQRLPIWENVSYPLLVTGTSGQERREIARHWLAQVGLEDRADSRPEELSGGELRRVGVARALAVEPDLILADEPTSDLDRDTARRVSGLLEEFHASGGTLVVATHDPREDASRARLVRLERGRIVS